jgi:hypothetical protein
VVPPPHERPGLLDFKRYTQSLDTLELSVFISFLFFITIEEVCMLKSETSLLGVNNVIDENFLLLSTTHIISIRYSGHVLSLVMRFSWRVTTNFRGNVYIMITIEHFSKWVKLIALLNRSLHSTN